MTKPNTTKSHKMENPNADFHQNLEARKNGTLEKVAAGGAIAPVQLEAQEKSVRGLVAQFDELLHGSLEKSREITRAVIEIRSTGDWKKRCSNWKDYCTEYLGKSHMYFERHEKYVKECDALLALPESTEFGSKTPKSNTVLPQNPKEAAALSRVPDEKKAEVLAEAAKEGKVTAKSIKAAAEKVVKKKPIEVEAEAVEMDEIGVEIPKTIFSEWSRAKSTGKELQKKASEIRVALKQDDLIFAEAKGVVDEAEVLHAALKNIIPHAVCPYCGGKKCKVCHKRGFVSKHFYDKDIPAEMKK